MWILFITVPYIVVHWENDTKIARPVMDSRSAPDTFSLAFISLLVLCPHHTMAAVLPAQVLLGPTFACPPQASVLSTRARHQHPQPEQSHFALCPSRCLPVVDLSHTIAKKEFPARTYRFLLRLMQNHFHHLVWFFRFGALCFAALFFVQEGIFHFFLLSMMVPSTAALFATLLFLSLDLLRLLSLNYDYWFLSGINTLNWVTFAYVLHDERAVMSFLGWLSFEIVLSVDASYRTTETAVNSMILAIPIVLVLCGLVSLQAVDQGVFLTITISGYMVCDATDVIGFTTSTLAILLAKMVLLKKRHTNTPVAGSGFSKQPCALIRTTLRVVAVANLVPTGPSSLLLTPPATSQPHVQSLQLSPTQFSRFNAQRTLIPWYWWSSSCMEWLFRRRLWFRRLFFTLGGTAFIFLIVQSTHQRAHRLAHATTNSSTTGSSSPVETCHRVPLPPRDRLLNLLTLAGSTLFCGGFVLVFQLDLLRCLLLNFDFVFSVGQSVVFNLSVLDMCCYDTDAVLLIASWQLWFTWSLSIDAITPLIQLSPLRFPKKLATCGLLGGVLAGLTMGFDVIFQANNGLRNRVVATFTASASHTLHLTTRSVLLGRVATIALWSSRQVYVLLTRGDDELNLIRGLLEYESPYSAFPRMRTKPPPAIPEDDA